MLKPGKRAWIALTLLATLLVPTAGSIAGPREELQEKKEALEELQEQIDAHEAQANTLEEEADAINDNMVRLRKELAKLDREIAEIESDVRTAQARIDSLQAEIDKLERVATQQAVSLYKSGATETLDALLNARSLTELDNRVEMLGVAAQENTGALIQFGRLQVEVEAAHQVLFDEKQRLEGAHDRHAAVLASLNEQHTKLAAKLAAIEAKLGEEHAHEGSLEDAIQGIEATILEKTTLHSVAILGKSSQGYIWPLNGAINSYYGPRWGRMHTGLDIDGTTGQPIVASNSGTVILASSYSGYGNTVIIDHGGVQTLYAHLSSYDVSEGQQIAQGKIIGRVGCTGSCTGDHLHFEVRVNGSPVDPLDYLP
ncbi:MAG TPA: peptidoglycan DD-metalloendopeptidase family protein [Actinomycetota bacterium]|nr:peptidoglycan DD-metalloendopeptidase family protein [Actinomycetota bacterium]